MSNIGIRSMVGHRDPLVAFMAAERLAAGVDDSDDTVLSDIWQMVSPCCGEPVMPHLTGKSGGAWYEAFEMSCRACDRRTPASYWCKPTDPNSVKEGGGR